MKKSKLVGRKVVIRPNDKHPNEPLSPKYRGVVGVIFNDVDKECQGAFAGTIPVKTKLSGVAAFFADELRYLNNREVQL